MCCSTPRRCSPYWGIRPEDLSGRLCRARAMRSRRLTRRGAPPGADFFLRRAGSSTRPCFAMKTPPFQEVDAPAYVTSKVAQNGRRLHGPPSWAWILWRFAHDRGWPVRHALEPLEQVIVTYLSDPVSADLPGRLQYRLCRRRCARAYIGGSGSRPGCALHPGR